MDQLSQAMLYLKESLAVQEGLFQSCAQQLVAAATLITSGFQSGNSLILAGNGGCLSICQSLASTLIGHNPKKHIRPPMNTLVLGGDAFITGYATQHHFEEAVSRQLQAWLKPKDVFMVLSLDGFDENLFWALKMAENKKAYCITLTGNSGKIQKLANIAIKVPSREPQYVLEAHMTLVNCLTHLIEGMWLN